MVEGVHYSAKARGSLRMIECGECPEKCRRQMEIADLMKKAREPLGRQQT
jgi:predicted aldo/keto reductase-like oxidoreductase